MFKITINESTYVKIFFAILLLYYTLQQVYPLYDFTAIKTVFIYVVVVSGIIKSKYHGLKSVPLLFNIGFALILLICVMGVYQGVYSEFKYVYIYGDASKVIIFPFLFYFFYINITSRDNFYSVLLFIGQLAIVSAATVALFYFANIAEDNRFNYLLSYIPIAYMAYKGTINNKRVSLFILLSLSILIPFAKGIGSLVSLMVFYFALVFRDFRQAKSIVYLFLLALLFLIADNFKIIDGRVLSKFQIIFSNEYSFIYIVEYIMAGRLTEFVSVIYGNNLIIGNGFGAKILPVLIDDSLRPWYDGLMSSVSHSMHSVMAELILKVGIVGFLIVAYYYLILLKRSFLLKTKEGKVVFAMSVMIFQGMIFGQPLVDAFILPSFLLAFLLKINPTGH